jgi:hypothetical protein
MNKSKMTSKIHNLQQLSHSHDDLTAVFRFNN